MKTNLIIGICLLIGNYSTTAQIAPSLTVPKGHKNNVRNCYFTPNDKYLVSTDNEHVLSIWDGDDGRQIFTFQDSTASFSKVEINKASNLIAALTDSGKLYLFHLTSLKTELLKDSVSDFSMQKNDGIIFMISSGSVYKYIPGRLVLKKLNITPIINPAGIFALTGKEACVKETDGDIFILNETTGRALPIPGSKNLVLHDLHAETGFILCSEIKTSEESITYYNIEARSRTIRGRISVKGQFRNPSCTYTTDHNIFLSAAISEDADHMIITNTPLLYSFKTGKVVREAGEKFVYSIDELNLNVSRSAYVTEQAPDEYLKIFRQNFPGTASSQVIFFRNVMNPEYYNIACANNTRKVAIFNSEFLLPGIYPSGTVGADGFTNVKKMATHRINFFPDDPKLQEKKAGRKIGFLAEEEMMLNDSVIFARYYSLEKGYEGMLYYLKKSQVIDSFRFSFDYLSNPLKGTTRLFLTRKNRFYELDIARRSLTDSFDLAPHILVRKLFQEGKSILIEREDSLANP
ncbi:MAG TPA: WD40 repeat domain-containing protein, partial [Chitinophagaceae bacterium]|nr:WD40 repeat domain-containing protein [Chitinophagaceae bacterium]